jgi:hypothetical protein
LFKKWYIKKFESKEKFVRKDERDFCVCL